MMHSCRSMLAAALCGVLALGLSGCQTNPLTGRNQLLLVSESDAQRASLQAYTKTLGAAQVQRRLDTDPARTARVQAITKRLVAQAVRTVPASAQWPWQVHVIDDDAVNAWCMPGGKMAVFTGLITRLNITDEELAQVIGHEISHALLQHGRERMSRAIATNVGLQVGSIATGVNLTGLENVAMIALELPNNRTAETEADILGIELAARAGYHPNSAVTLWQKMSKLGGSKPPQWLSTHPSDENRIANLQALVPRMLPIYEAAVGKR